MSVVMMMEWPGVSLEQYEALRKLIDLDANPPVGGMIHVASHDGEMFRVVDVWESPEQFQEFAESRLMPAVQQIGISGQPDVKIIPIHNLFTPAFTAK